jgi:hypothetical protein
VTVTPALAGVSVLCVLLGGATGPAEKLEALHGPRLEMLLTRIIDAPVRAFIYEGPAGALVSSFCSRSRIPFAVIGVDDPPTVIADVIESRLLS